LKIQDGACHAITNLLVWGVCDSLTEMLLRKGHKWGGGLSVSLYFVKKPLIFRGFLEDQDPNQTQVCATLKPI
jgi:hypothetical protein